LQNFAHYWVFLLLQYLGFYAVYIHVFVYNCTASCSGIVSVTVGDKLFVLLFSLLSFLLNRHERIVFQ